MNSNVHSRVSNARCPAAGSLDRALNRAVSIVFEEFRIPGDLPLVRGRDCSALRGSWEKERVSILERMAGKRERTQRRLSLALKSCARLFDQKCPPCDRRARSSALRSWDSHVAEDVPSADLSCCRAFVPLLKKHVRSMTEGWGRRLKECRFAEGVPRFGEYVPDIQGCLEVPTGLGGTLACAPSEYSRDPALVRRGVAKTKGKHRVVTMQSAGVKRVLAPVHNALYDHISSFDWCVRGDVRREDFAAVVGDLRRGERFISGDYQAATDNIYLPAVEAIVEVLAESPELSEEERRVLLGSFRNLRWLSSSGATHPIKRGSMMGNLVSFPLLCLLNKACHDIARDVCSPVPGVRRVGRFNGDDCMFSGDDAFFGTWQLVTGIFGLVVNREKTGVSRRWLELNSQPYDVTRGSMVSKPVLSFLLPPRHTPGSILPSIISGVSSFRWSVRLKVVTMLRHEICLRGVRDTLGCLSPKWRSELFSRRWFRAGCLDDPAPLNERGENRSPTVVVGPPPDSRVYDFLTEFAVSLSRETVEKWRGVKVRPFSQLIDRRAYSARRRYTSPRLSSFFSWGGYRWRFNYPGESLSLLTEGPLSKGGFVRTWSKAKWVDDHPLLSRGPVVLERPRVPARRSFPPPLSLSRPSLPRRAVESADSGTFCNWEVTVRQYMARPFVGAYRLKV